MADRRGFWRTFLDRPNDDRVKTLGVALGVALISAIVVSVASVLLQPLQDVHIARERQARIDAMIDALPGMRDLMLETGVDALDGRLVDLATGTFVQGDPAGFDLAAAALDPAQSTALAAADDIAGIRTRSNLAPVYLLEREGVLMLIVLPVYGTGYQSTIRAMLALQPDLRTIAALTVLEQGETPGLGARVAEPGFQAQWPGKQITDGTGAILISVVKDGADGPYEVDALTGATRTSNAVQAMLQFWLGDLGYGPLLARLQAEGL